MEVLRFDHVSKVYVSDGAPVPALRDVSAGFRRGEFAALVGRSGCGKSTLLNLGGAMDFPSTGQVTIDGRTTSDLDDAGLTQLRRTRVGFVFQSFQLLPTLTVVENVELPLLLGGGKKARKSARERLSWVEMDVFEGRMPYQLSGGQMQRVAIARALVNSPAVLLADEPTGNLDTSTGDVVLALLRRIAREQGTTILMATHSMEAAGVTDTVIRMRDGLVEA